MKQPRPRAAEYPRLGGCASAIHLLVRALGDLLFETQFLAVPQTHPTRLPGRPNAVALIAGPAGAASAK